MQFEAIDQLPPEEQAVVKEVLESLIIKYQTRRWDVSRATAKLGGGCQGSPCQGAGQARSAGCAMSAGDVPAPAVQSISLSIATLRGQRVILDYDMAALYEVETKRFNEAFKRNLVRFPADFMFQLTADEQASLRSQFATLKTGRGQHRKYLPYAFTEHGAIMAATLLNSPRAVAVSVYVVRAFVRLRELAATHQELAQRLAELEDKTESLAMQHDMFSRNTRAALRRVFEELKELKTPPEPHKRPIGFVHPKEGKDADGKAAAKGRKG